MLPLVSARFPASMGGRHSDGGPDQLSFFTDHPALATLRQGCAELGEPWTSCASCCSAGVCVGGLRGHTHHGAHAFCSGGVCVCMCVCMCTCGWGPPGENKTPINKNIIKCYVVFMCPLQYYPPNCQPCLQ